MSPKIKSPKSTELVNRALCPLELNNVHIFMWGGTRCIQAILRNSYPVLNTMVSGNIRLSEFYLLLSKGGNPINCKTG